jgi:hypothetical protein
MTAESIIEHLNLTRMDFAAILPGFLIFQMETEQVEIYWSLLKS